MSESEQSLINGEAHDASLDKDPISAAVDAAIGAQEEITPAEQAHLQHVYECAAQADRDLQQAAANLNMAIGARASFVQYLLAVYGLDGNTEGFEVETGKIVRASPNKE
jgi:hypothetical protein